MKKSIKIVALMLVLVMALGVLASCGGGLSGTYKSDAGVEITFEGSTIKIGEYETDYEIDGDKMILGQDVAEDDFAAATEAAMIWLALGTMNGEVAFEEIEGGIKLGGVEYKAQ